jgi:hypothetical protein
LAALVSYDPAARWEALKGPRYRRFGAAGGWSTRAVRALIGASHQRAGREPPGSARLPVPAAKLHLYNKAWIRRLVAELQDEDGFEAIWGSPPMLKSSNGSSGASDAQ